LTFFPFASVFYEHAPVAPFFHFEFVWMLVWSVDINVRENVRTMMVNDCKKQSTVNERDPLHILLMFCAVAWFC